MANKSSCSKVGEKALVIDSFGRPFEFMLPNGSKKYRSLVGSIMTLVTVMIVAVYSSYKWQLLIDKEQVTNSQSIDERHFDSSNSILDLESGFNLAVGIFGLNSGRDLVFDETYGKLTVV